MTFVRALILALLVAGFVKDVEGSKPALDLLFDVVLCGFLWSLTPDPTKERVKEAIEEIREEWRREP